MSTIRGRPGGFTAHFIKGDRWAYPRFLMPQEADLDRVEGILVRARCVKPAIVRLMSWNDGEKMSFTTFSLIPSDGNWHVCFIPLDSFLKAQPGANPSKLGRQLKTLSIGFNTKENENHLDVSDLYLLGK